MLKPGDKLLVVDSDLHAQFATQDKVADRFLEAFPDRLLKLGYDVRLAEDGFDALQQMATAVPDVLISSLELHGMSGIELQSFARRQFPMVYIIILRSEILRKGLLSCALQGGYPEETPGIYALLQKVGRGLAKDRRSPLSYRKSAPLVFRRGESSRFFATELFARCSECQMSFPQLTDANRLQRETACVHCRIPLKQAPAHQLLATL